MRRLTAPDVYPIPGTDAVFDAGYDDMDEPTLAVIRCSGTGCRHRLFDLELVPVSRRSPGSVPEFYLRRRCPHCRQINVRLATTVNGRARGESGTWRCEHCSDILAKIDAPRGRITVRCPKCRLLRRVASPAVWHQLAAIAWEQYDGASPAPTLRDELTA